MDAQSYKAALKDASSAITCARMGYPDGRGPLDACPLRFATWRTSLNMPEHERQALITSIVDTFFTGERVPDGALGDRALVAYTSAAPQAIEDRARSIADANGEIRENGRRADG